MAAMHALRIGTALRIAALLAPLGCGAVAVLQPSTSLRDHVSYLAELDPPRCAAHPEALMEAADYIERHLREAGGEVALQDYQVDGETYRNVSAFFGPGDGRRLVVGAHYDVCGHMPGADDNASGVAVLLELAERLGEDPPRGRVELVAYSLEEPPHYATPAMGSAQHAQALKQAGVELRGMLCLEMLGYFSDEPDSQRYPSAALARLYPSTGNFVAVVGRGQDAELVHAVHAAMAEASELPAMKLVASSLLGGLTSGIDLSDHRNYWEAGYTATMITDTAFMRNPHYHEKGDTPETLDYRRMGVEAAVRVLLED